MATNDAEQRLVRVWWTVSRHSINHWNSYASSPASCKSPKLFRVQYGKVGTIIDTSVWVGVDTGPIGR